MAFYRTKLKSSVVADAVAKEIKTKISNSGRRLSSSFISVSSSSYAAGVGTPEYDGDFSAEVGGSQESASNDDEDEDTEEDFEFSNKLAGSSKVTMAFGPLYMFWFWLWMVCRYFDN